MESITGIGDVIVQRTEYLSSAVLRKYTENIAILQSIMNKQEDISYVPTTEDYNNIVTVIRQLSNLAKNGIQEGTTDNPITSHLNGNMADNLNLVMQSLKIVNISTDSPIIDTINIPSTTPHETILQALNSLGQWQSLRGFGIGQILLNGVNLAVTLSTVTWKDPLTGKFNATPYSATNTLQSMMESVYVSTGNSVISSQLNTLEIALKTTNDLAGILTVIQNLSNNVRVSTNRKSTYSSVNSNGTAVQVPIGTKTFASIFQMPTTGTISNAQKAYSAAATAYFSQLSVEPTGNTTPVELYNAKITLYTSLLKLESVDPSHKRNVEGSLAANIFAVIKDISAEFSAVPYDTSHYTSKEAFLAADPTGFSATFINAANFWVIDSQNASLTASANTNNLGSKVNKIQNDLVNAITNTEILNDQQRDKVRGYLLVFEEFYKSASGMLELLTKILRKMGKKITN